MTIELTEQELALIGLALGKLPYVDVFGLIDNINKQFNADDMHKG